jgi:hypothetical protein
VPSTAKQAAALVYGPSGVTVPVQQLTHRYNQSRYGQGTSPRVMSAEMYANRPEEDTAFPSTLPPPTRNMVCQFKLLKSTCAERQYR